MRFWDTSALIPLLVGEPATAWCSARRAEDRQVAVWTLTRVELMSALHRRLRAGDLDRAALPHLRARVDRLEAAWTEVTSLGPVRELAERLLATHPLRAADALQLGAAEQVGGLRGGGEADGARARGEGGRRRGRRLRSPRGAGAGGERREEDDGCGDQGAGVRHGVEDVHITRARGLRLRPRRGAARCLQRSGGARTSRWRELMLRSLAALAALSLALSFAACTDPASGPPQAGDEDVLGSTPDGDGDGDGGPAGGGDAVPDGGDDAVPDGGDDAELPPDVDAGGEDDEDCHYDCFGGASCQEGVLLEYGYGPAPCDVADDWEAGKECVIGEVACQEAACGAAGCAEDDAWLAALIPAGAEGAAAEVEWTPRSESVSVSTINQQTGFTFVQEDATWVASVEVSTVLRSTTWTGGATLVVDGVELAVTEVTVTSGLLGESGDTRLCPGAAVATLADGEVATVVWTAAPTAAGGLVVCDAWSPEADVELVVAVEE